MRRKSPSNRRCEFELRCPQRRLFFKGMTKNAESGIEVRPVGAAETYVIRGPVLRPGLPESESRFPGDYDESALHIGALEGDTLVGTASFFMEDHPQLTGDGLARLRGMAVLPACQSRGIGTAMLRCGLETLRARAVPMLWCNARERAVPFYRAQGFMSTGEAFDIPGIGPHFLMHIALV